MDRVLGRATGDGAEVLQTLRGATQESQTTKGVRLQTYAKNCAGCLSGL